VPIPRAAKHVPPGSWPSLARLTKDWEESAEQGLLSLTFLSAETVSTKASQWCSSTVSKDAARG